MVSVTESNVALGSNSEQHRDQDDAEDKPATSELEPVKFESKNVLLYINSMILQAIASSISEVWVRLCGGT